MPEHLMTAVDLLLLLLATARVVRLVVADDLGKLLVQEPVGRWQARVLNRLWESTPQEKQAELLDDDSYLVRPTRVRLADMVGCPWCIGFWIGCAILASLLVAWSVAGGFLVAWRVTALALALNYAVVHLGSALGDYDGTDEEDQT